MKRFKNRRIKTGLLFGAVLVTAFLISCDMLTPGLGDSVDLDAPDLSIDQEANFYVMGTTTVSGTVTDDTTVDTVSLTYTGTDGSDWTVFATFSDESSWSVDLSSGSGADSDMAEGEQTFSVTALDTTGRSTTVDKTCWVDNTMPTVLITSPLLYSSIDESHDESTTISKYIDLKGEVYDDFDLSDVEVALFDSSDNQLYYSDSTEVSKTASGTTIWSVRFYLKSESDGETLSDVLTDGEIYTYMVYAEDEAGNVNEGYLHRDDFYDMIDDLDTFPSMDEIGLADRDTPEEGSLVTGHDQLEEYRHYPNPETDQLSLAGFTYSSDDQPEIVYQNLDSTAADAADNELYQKSDVIGYINPADGSDTTIDEDSLSVSFYKDSETTPFLTLENTEDDDSDGIETESSDSTVTFSLTLQDEGEYFDAGEYSLIMTVQDSEETYAPSVEVPFTIVTGDYPTIAITGPDENETYGASSSSVVLTLEGVIDEYAIDDVSVKIDDGDYSDATGSGTSWSWGLTQTDYDALDDGLHTLTVYSLGAIKTWYFRKDATAPTIEIIDPLSGTTHNGSVTIYGACDDNTNMESIEIYVGDYGDRETDDWELLEDSTYSWTYELSNLEYYASSDYATETSADSNIWELYIYVRAIDEVGNEAVMEDYYLYLDPEGDQPEIVITSPEDDEVTGGEIQVYGTASDDDALYSVEYQLDVNGDGDYDDTAAAYADGSGTYDETAVYEADGTSSWSFTINEDGELASDTEGEQNEINLRVRAVDTKDGVTADKESSWTEVSLTIDNTLPIVEEVEIDFDDSTDSGDEESYESGMIVSGSFWIDAIVKDESGIDQIDRVDLSPLSGTTQIDDDSSITWDLADEDGYLRKQIHIPVDTINDGIFADTSGTFTINIKATDNTDPNPYTTYYSVSLSVDNYYPEGSYTASTDVSGDEYKLTGTATDTGTDSGTVEGIEKIVLYLEDSSTYYNGGTGDSSSSSTSLTVKNRDNSDTVESISLPDSSDYLISIDSFTEMGVSDSDGDGYIESLSQSGDDYNWWAQIDSTLLPDGEMTVHYLIYDEAGNISHSSEELFIGNNPPLISSIELATDLDYSGTVDSDESTTFTSDYDSTDFTVRNNLLTVTINKTSDTGNGTVSYTLTDTYGSGGSFSGDFSDDSVTIDIGSFGNDTDSNGATYSLIIYDTEALNQSSGHSGETITLAMNLDNSDDTSPTLGIAPFGQFYSDGEDDSAKTLSSVDSYTDNILLEDDEVMGHVEYADDSSHDGSDADLSGEVIFYGKAWDNQKISTITALIDGYNGDAAFDVYDEATGALSDTDGDWTFALEGDSADEGSTGFITEEEGNVFNWTFTFDTSQISDVAANDVEVTFTISDAGGTSSDGSDSLTVDIVPYITSLERDGDYNTNRSHYGKYPVQSGEILIVNGFNLDGNTSHTVGSNSGSLSVTVNGIESINNSNDNDLSYNSEDEGSDESELWNDDRYLSVWGTGNYFAESDETFVSYPSMSQDSSGELYAVWSERSMNRMVMNTIDGTKESLYTTYDPPEYTDIYVDSDDEVNIAYLTNYQSGSQWGWMAVYTANAPNSVSFSSIDYYYYGIESLRDDERLLQFQQPRIAEQDDSIHVVYYDEYTGAAKYSQFDDDGSGAVSNNNNSNEKGWVVLDGGYDSEDDEVVSNGETQSSAAGEYISIDLDEEGYPVVMYYDNENSTLKLAWSRSADTTEADNWTRQTVFQSDDDYALQSGTHIMMKIDSSGNIHAVCYNTGDNDLLYLYASDADGTSNYSFDYAVAIDTQGASGEGADLILNGDEPHVSYRYLNKASTVDGLKYAYQTTVDSETVWEYMIVPAEETVEDARTCIEYNKGSVWTGSIAISYLSDRYELVYLQEE
ncbi:MAG: hypothetical protein PQJ59_15405 [Spirochaetales bacterium]|nr:hypothetical protein [Spirochaetales bacterium]